MEWVKQSWRRRARDKWIRLFFQGVLLQNEGKIGSGGEGRKWGQERAFLLSKGFSIEMVSLIFLASRSHLHSLAHGLFLPSSKLATLVQACLILPSLWFCFLIHFLLLRIQIIQGKFLISSQLISNLNSIWNLNSLLLSNLTFSQVPVIKV